MGAEESFEKGKNAAVYQKLGKQQTGILHNTPRYCSICFFSLQAFLCFGTM
jgi:hypothetical protein